MRHIYELVLLIFLQFACISRVNSQVETTFEGNLVSSGSTNNYSVATYNTPFFFYIEFKNISGTNKNYTLKRKRIINPTSWTPIATTWELLGSSGFCYVPNTQPEWTTLNSLLTGNNETVRYQDHYSVSNDSCMHYRYYLISVEVGVEDSIDVIGCSILGLEEISLGNKKLVKIVDITGRDTEDKPNTQLIYVYSDGTTEKVFRVE